MNQSKRIAAPVVLLLVLVGAAPSTSPAQTATDSKIRWSHSDLDKTPTGLEFHGPFFNETITVSTDKLPAHDWLAISMDLLVLRSWDGSVPMKADGTRSPDGPDYFRVGLDGGPTLLFTTFSNNPPDDPGFQAHSKAQNFPSMVPGEHFRAQTGSVEHNTLGYNYPWAGPPQLVPMDAVYHLRFVVPHRGPDVAVQLSAQGLGANLIDENWGARNVVIHPVAGADVSSQEATKIARAFADALDVKGDNQADAPLLLVLGGDATVDWIGQNVQPQPIDSKEAQRLLTDLAGDDMKIDQREAAGPALMALGSQVEVFARDARRTAPGELRTRLDTILCFVGVQQIDDEKLRRVMLATRVLEIIGTPKAMALRHKLVSE